MCLTRRIRLLRQGRFGAARLWANSCLMDDTIYSEALRRQIEGAAKDDDAPWPGGAWGMFSIEQGNAWLSLTFSVPLVYGTNPGTTRGARWRMAVDSMRGASMASRA